jgi:hypothetical protein
MAVGVAPPATMDAPLSQRLGFNRYYALIMLVADVCNVLGMTAIVATSWLNTFALTLASLLTLFVKSYFIQGRS